MLPTSWVIKKIFPSKFPKATLSQHFLPFRLTEKDQICILYQETFIEDCVKELCKKSFENTLN